MCSHCAWVDELVIRQCATDEQAATWNDWLGEFPKGALMQIIGIVFTKEDGAVIQAYATDKSGGQQIVIHPNGARALATS